MAVAEADVDLQKILHKSSDKSWNVLLPGELQLLLTAFLPSRSLASRSTAYIVLSVICQRLRETTSRSKLQQESDTSTESITSAFASSLISKLAETTEGDVLTDWQAASAILLQEGVYDILDDIPDIFFTSPSVSLALAHLLAQAAGHKSCRAIISSRAVQWLEGKARQKEDNALRAAAAVSLVKLNKGSVADAAANPLASAAPPTSTGGGTDEDLVKLMKGLVLDAQTSSPSSSIQDAVEGLAYLSVDPNVKELLASDAAFLSRLFAIIPRRKGLWADSSEGIGMTPLYGTVLIIANLCAYRPRLSEEETQIAKLRKLAKAPGSESGSNAKLADAVRENGLDDNEHVLARGRKLLKAGVMDALTSAVKATGSQMVRSTVGKVLLSLVEDNTSRGQILQSGGAKALITILQGILSSSSGSDKSKVKPQLDVADLEPIQALAKLAITSSPVQVFGPNPGAMYDAIRPFTLILIHSSSTLLQQFEAIMALTNISSASAEAADKIAHSEGLMNHVELLMLEDHTLIRRASVELVCNMIAGSESVYEKYGAGEGEACKKKLQVLVALCDVEDLATRMAASGAVATVTASPVACQHLLELQTERRRVLPILGQLIDPSIIPPSDHTSGVEVVDGDDDETEASQRQTEADPGLMHRGVICIRNLFVGITGNKEGSMELAQEAQELGLVKALANVFKTHSANRSSPVLRPVAEALKCMMENGIPIQS